MLTKKDEAILANRKVKQMFILKSEEKVSTLHWGKLLESSKFADMKLIVGQGEEQQEFLVHKVSSKLTPTK
jgi:hypothetical protein